MPKVYSLQVVFISGKTLRLNFFDYGDSKWGMWCNKGPKPKRPYSFSTRLDLVIIVPPTFEHQYAEIEALLTLQGLFFCDDE